jgi:hypothetical protein
MINVNLDAWNKLDQETWNIVLENAAEMEDEMRNLAPTVVLILMTLPIALPMVTAAGFDPIW